jgi:hypothetical protein
VVDAVATSSLPCGRLRFSMVLSRASGNDRVVERIGTGDTRFYLLSFAIRSQFVTLLTMARVLSP